ncbi:MAG: NAD(P)/FAD-dependent oxidoreductase [Candidatus Methylomirabilales bacterium]
MAETTDVIIVGAGVVGCSIAYHLAQKGVKRVVVLDRGEIGGEASGAAAGMLAPQCEAAGPGPFLDFCLAARQYYERLAPMLKDLAHVDIDISPGVFFTSSTRRGTRQQRGDIAGRKSLGWPWNG